MGNQAQNAQNIKTKFEAFRQRTFAEILTGLERLLTAGVEFCLDEHDENHQRHLETGDSYGWVSFYNGKEMNRQIWAKGRAAEGNASLCLDKMASLARPVGFDGFVVAGMALSGESQQTPKNSSTRYFRWTYEFIPMREAIADIKGLDFSQYFSRI